MAIGDPDWDISFRLVDTLLELGADTIELGLPFTDPIADGVYLQRAFKRILSQPFKYEKYLDFLSKLHTKYPEQPFLTMGYSNLFLQNGFAKTFQDLIANGVSGIITPDIPFEEKEKIIKKEKLSKFLQNLSWINFITPTTPNSRLVKICKNSSGFLYVVSIKGVTGQEGFSLRPIEKLLKQIEKITSIPKIIGFGIRKKEHAKEASQKSEGFIIGTLIHQTIEENLERKSDLPQLLKSKLTPFVNI